MPTLNIRKKNILSFILVYCLCIGLSYFTCAIWELGQNQLISIMVLSLFGHGFLMFIYSQECENNALLYDNYLHKIRFLGVYLICYMIILAFPLLPVSSWFFPVIGVTLMLFSNRLIACIGTSFFIIQTVFLVGEGIEVFALCFIGNIVALFAFRFLDEKFSVAKPLLLVCCVQITMTTAMIIMFTNDKMSIDLFVIPIINLFLITILLLVILKQFSTMVIYRYHQRYMVINDQTFELMGLLKKQSLKTYLSAIHTAYLVERISNQLQLDTPCLKSCAYYQHLDKAYETSPEPVSISEVMISYEFPQEVIDLIEELSSGKLHTKEATIVSICDSIISKIVALHKLNEKQRELTAKEITNDYQGLIHNFIRKEYDNGTYNESDLSIAELKQVEELLIGEGLYYDFLY